MSHLLEGEDRIEQWKAVGRRMRMGKLTGLAVADLDRVRQAIRMGSKDQQQAWVRYVTANHETAISLYAEWILTWPEAMSVILGPAEGMRSTQEAIALWTAVQKPEGGDAVFKLIATFFNESVLVPEAAAAFRQYASAGQAFPMVEALLQAPRLIMDEVQSDLRANNLDQAVTDLERYWTEVRLRHDYLGQLLWAFAGAVASLFDQEVAEEAQRVSYTSCSFYEPLWSEIGKLPPADLVLLLTDYLRAHFSGTGRSGTVEIEEEADRYRIIMKPCGTGGAMRRQVGPRNTNTLGVFANAGPSTWGRKGKVPAFCSQCALQELLSVERVGYPAWVTEFNPDATRPCGWTVYKSPDQIPDAYFERLGLKKDPSKFVRPPV